MNKISLFDTMISRRKFLLCGHQTFKRFSSLANEKENPVVAVKQGKLQGKLNKLLNGSPYYSFKGVPYAQTPLGEHRFKAPFPPQNWEGTRDATKHGPICPQFDITTSQVIDGDENCLFLNIYTKSLSNSKLPVMVYIHGGGFMSGSGDEASYGPLFLLQHDVLLITLNYRLETLGFLCVDTLDVPGNAGLKDQVAALKWVKENVEKFGGDPDNITLFGESAGGSSVTYHMLSDMSKDLFHKAIVQSGTCIQDWAMGTDSIDRAFRIGKLLGIETNDKDELINHLRKLPANDLRFASFATRTSDERYRGLPVCVVPVVEKVGDNPFITEDPADLLLKKKVHKVPLIIGYNSSEGIMSVKDQLKKGHLYNRKPQFNLPKEIVQRITKDKAAELGERLKTFYFGDKGWRHEVMQEISDLQTDRLFAYNTHRFTQFYNEVAPTYMYRFDCDTELNFSKIFFGLDVKGACHADDLCYFFSNRFNRKLYKEKENLKEIIDKLTKMWTDFAKAGNPTPDNQLGFKWEPFTSAQEKYLSIGNEMVLSSHADRQRMEFWNELYREAGLPSISYNKDRGQKERVSVNYR